MSLLKSAPILLIDMDGVVFDYYGYFSKLWKEKYPERIYIEPENLKNFYMEDDYGQHYKKDILAIAQSEGFFENIPPMEGAVEALQGILKRGNFHPFLCSSPDIEVPNRSGFSEKARAIEKHLCKDWLKRTVFTKDKTLVRGAFLIDDKPEIKGVMQPEWQRIVFSHAFNVSTPGLRLDHWRDWSEQWGEAVDQRLLRELQKPFWGKQ